jgi:DNA-directed RNA polymerase subunit RPC12/RpoP
MSVAIAGPTRSRWICAECGHEFDVPRQVEGQSPGPVPCPECGSTEDFTQLGGLTPVAIATLAMAGITVDQWIEAASFGSVPPDGSPNEWTGDICGCLDDRCANGFHHMGVTDCGCLPVEIETYLEKGEL